MATENYERQQMGLNVNKNSLTSCNSGNCSSCNTAMSTGSYNPKRNYFPTMYDFPGMMTINRDYYDTNYEIKFSERGRDAMTMSQLEQMLKMVLPAQIDAKMVTAMIKGNTLAKYGVEDIFQNRSKKKGIVTTIKWLDGTITSVTKQNNDTDNIELAVAMCFVKRMLGNKGNYYDAFTEMLSKVISRDKDTGEKIQAPGFEYKFTV